MEDEVDLRAYVRILLKYWIVMAGCVLAGALVAGGISLATPRVYQASATLTASAATPNIAALTKSDAVLKATIANLGTSLPANLAQPAALRSSLAASQAADSTTVQLTVSDGDSGRAATIVNAWAEAVMQEIQRSYSGNNVLILQAQLNAQQSLLFDVFAHRYTLEWAGEEARGLRDRLAKQPSDSPASMEDVAVLLSLSLQSSVGPSLQVYTGQSQQTCSLSSQQMSSGSFIGSSLQSSSGPSIQLQFSSLTTRTVGNQLQAVESLLEALTMRRQALQTRMEALQTDILETQQQQVSEQITFITPFTVHVNQSADVPASPAEPRTTRNLLLGIAVGLVVGAGLAFAWEWWKQGAA